MTKRTALKNVIWAICIALALLALLIGLFTAAIGHYYGDKERPVMNIGVSAPKSAKSTPALSGAGQGTVADGQLHELKSSGDAGQSYLDGLTFLCDSSAASLKNSGLVNEQKVWTGEARTLPMTTAFSWRIVYPGDKSIISPDAAAMVAKPGILVIAVGSDDVGSISREDFIENYEIMIRAILDKSPDTRVVCGPVFSVTAAYAGQDAPSAERAPEINEWIRQVCTDTGAYYADWFLSLTNGGYLRPEYAEADGRTLSTAGLSALLGWLRTHADA